MKIFNTREDLDAAQGTVEHTEFMNYLKGSMTRMENRQIYPEDYNSLEYTGDELEPIWEEVEDLSTIERFGFTKEEFN